MSNFRIIEHKIPCSYVREFPQATANDQEEDLFLAVKQYIPIDNPNPRPGDITIIGAHANGFPKELYEPLWEDLQTQTKKRGFRIRSIWIADVAHQGESSVINERALGNDPGWYDHARDLTHLINLKRKEMPRPLFGIGHSMGGNNLVNVALFNPRLFTSLILLDPVVQARSAEILPAGASSSVAQLSTFRRDTWPSRQAAADSFLKSKFYSSWDKRVFDRWVKFGLRDLPTPLHPEPQPAGHPPKVTLTTTVGGEVRGFLRPNFEGYGHKTGQMNRITHPDIDPNIENTFPFYRSEPPRTFLRLPELRPSALYVFGENSDVSDAKMNELKLSVTGTGIGGSGGRAEGKVKGVTMKGVGHLIPMEDSPGTAAEVAEWIDSEIETWREEKARFEEDWKPKSTEEKLAISEQWREMMGGDPRKKSKASKI